MVRLPWTEQGKPTTRQISKPLTDMETAAQETRESITDHLRSSEQVLL